MSISFLDLNRQYETIRDEVNEAIQEVLESQYFIMGEKVRSFEEEMSDYCEANHAYGCASGSDALLLALMTIDLQPGDYVITSPFTFFATAGAISRIGGIPIFLDIKPDSYNLDPDQLKAFLKGEHSLRNRIDPPSDKIKAVIPVHLYGQMADMDPIMDLAEEHNLYVIEDAAQAIGAKYKGRKAGSIGDFGCFSFFPSKNLGGYGDGGLITVKDQEQADKTDILRLHGARPKYHNKYVGINSRLDAIQAAILSVKLKHLDKWSEKRREVAMKYNSLFKEAGLDSELTLPEEIFGDPESGGRHIYHQYTIRTEKRAQVEEALNKHGIGNAVYYPVPLHEQECFSDLAYKKEDCPVANKAAREILSLPVYPELREEEIREVVNVVKSAIG